MLLFHPTIQIQAIFNGISYSFLNLVLTSFSDLFVTAYDEYISISGLHYIALCMGATLGSICGPFMDSTTAISSPERRRMGSTTPFALDNRRYRRRDHGRWHADIWHAPLERLRPRCCCVA